MPSFDVVNKIDMQELDNAINNTIKEIATRYDFRNLKTELTFDKKEKKIHIVAADKMKMDAVREMLLNKAVKRGLDIKAFEFEDPQPTSAGQLKRDVKVKEGIAQDTAKKMVRAIKDSKLKVQASIQGEELRVSGKQRDDLQEAMALLRSGGFEVPLQFVNFKD